jgi:trk system potassium uptake protein TrkH
LAIVARDVGALVVLLGACMLLPALVSAAYAELYSALSFVISAVVTAALGAGLYGLCRHAAELQRRQAMLVAGAGWLVCAVFGALPFWIAATITPDEAAAAMMPAGSELPTSLSAFRDPVHAFFESMSGYTTTGLTLAIHEPTLGRGLLFYRSLSQWVGGAGVIVLSLAIIPRPSVGRLELYQSEASGTKLRPNIIGTARAIWKTYSGLTLLCFVYLAVGTYVLLPDYGLERSLFDALNHAMTGQSTGGFSPLDDSIAGYGSSAMELLYLLPMLAGATALPLYYTFFRTKSPMVFLRDPQFRLMLALTLVGTAVVVWLLAVSQTTAHPLRDGLFQVVSALSTTGWQTSELKSWSDASALLLSLGPMLIGGAAGATVGGIKLIRVLLLAAAAKWRITKTLLPSEAIVPFKVGSRALSTQQMQREVADAGVFSFLYVTILTLSVIAVSGVVGDTFTLSNVVLECVSAQSTVGLSTGITSPEMPRLAEWVFIFQMWVGRLEIFPVIVLLRALLWPSARS